MTIQVAQVAAGQDDQLATWYGKLFQADIGPKLIWSCATAAL